MLGNIRLYTWVDVETVMEIAQQENNWPQSLVWVRTYWDGLTLGIRPNQQVEVLEWLKDTFEPRFVSTEESSYIILESLIDEERRFDVIWEETDEEPQRPKRKPLLSRASVLWPDAHTPPLEPLPDEYPPVVAFHSFKGGVGRTLHAIAFVRELSKSRPDKPVLLIDADLEAPGITWLLKSRFPTMAISLADFLALLHSDPDPTMSTSLKLVANRTQDLFLDNIYFLPAFRSDQQFSTIAVKPEHLIQAAHDPFMLTTMLARLGHELGVQAVVIDLRAGLSELATGLLLDPRVYRVLVTTLSGQSMEGTAYILELLSKLAPTKQEKEPLPALIMSQVPIEYEKDSSLLEPYKDKLLKLLETLAPVKSEEEEKNINEPKYLPDLLYLSYFNSDFIVLPSEWATVIERLSSSNILKQIHPLVEWLPANIPQESLADLDTLQQKRTDLANFTHKLIYAETTDDVNKFLAIAPLRRLVADHHQKIPIVVVVGAKGAGKTYTFLQIVRRHTWQFFIQATGEKELSKTSPVYVYSVLKSRSLNNLIGLNQEHHEIVQFLGFEQEYDSLETLDYIREMLTYSLNESQWRDYWLNIIAWRSGFRLGTTGIGQEFANYLRQRKTSVIAVIDGLEDIFQDVQSNQSQQIALRALLQDVPEWLEQQPGRPIGLLVFIRRDLVLSAIKQNSAQLMAKYEPYALKWSSEEALRLVAWIVRQVMDISGNDELKVEDMGYEALVGELVSLWGLKLGKFDSREPGSAAWIIAALSDFKGQIQARDLVRFLDEAAKASISHQTKDYWKDRLLVPAAIRKVIKNCSVYKIDEITKENPILQEIFTKLLSSPEKQIPFKSDGVKLTSDELKTLEDNGVIIREDESYYMAEIFRLGLDFKYQKGARPRVLVLSRQNSKFFR